MKNENYEYLSGLALKVRRYESFKMDHNFRKLYADEIKKYQIKTDEIGEEISELLEELKELKEPYIEKLKTEQYPYYSSEYDNAKEIIREINSLNNELDKMSQNVPEKKLTFDADDFFDFLSKYIGRNISCIKNFFGDAKNDLNREMNEHLAGGGFNFHNYINNKLPDYLPNDLQYIENKYNANVNCFKLTGKYIQDINKSNFKCKPELFFFYEYAEITGLLTEYDVYAICARSYMARPLNDEDPFTPEEYCYATFYKNSPNFSNELICTNYLINKFETLKATTKIDINDLVDMREGLVRKNLDTKNIEEFKRQIDDYIDSYIKKSLVYTDSDRILSNNGQEYPGSGKDGWGSK